MRTLKLTHDEICLIESAIEYVYSKKLQIIEQNRPILSAESISGILETANKYDNLRAEIKFGDKDEMPESVKTSINEN